MRCIHLNIRGASFLVLAVLLNGVKHTQMADNHMELVPNKEHTHKLSNISDDIPININNMGMSEDITLACPFKIKCAEMQHPCIICNLNYSCIYGKEINTTCRVKPEVKCEGDPKKEFQRTLICRYCYQTEPWEHTCSLKANCNSVATPKQYYRTNCSVKNDIICLGRRNFSKRVLCNWTGGYRWSTALALSITLGGFGADRFYLGHWQEGIDEERHWWNTSTARLKMRSLHWSNLVEFVEQPMLLTDYLNLLSHKPYILHKKCSVLLLIK